MMEKERSTDEKVNFNLSCRLYHFGIVGMWRWDLSHRIRKPCYCPWEQHSLSGI